MPVSPENLTTTVVTATLGTGGLVAWWRAKKTVPAERDNIIVTGAETAVQSLERSLQAETARADRLEKENSDLRRSLDDLERELNDVREQLMTALRGASEAQQRLTDLQNRLGHP